MIFKSKIQTASAMLSLVFVFSSLITASADEKKASNTAIRTVYNLTDSWRAVALADSRFSTDLEIGDKGFLLEKLSATLLEFPFISSAVITSDTTKSGPTSRYDKNIVTTRKSKISITLRLPAPMTLLFNAEEKVKPCKKTSTYSGQGSGPRGGGSFIISTDCSSFSSELKIDGPISVSTNFATNYRVEPLLKDTLTIRWDYTKESGGNKLVLGIKDQTDGSKLPINLSLVAKAMGVKLASATPVINPLWRAETGGNILSSKILYKNISRFLRTVNEKAIVNKKVVK